jgi:hypothetical protein
MNIKRSPKFVILIAFLIFSNLTAKTIKGTVFHDLNKNFKFDNGEPGIPNVLVSNQVDVVQTDDSGRYKLKVYDECIFFISKPSGYETAVDKNNLPKFYHIHRSQGSPQYAYSTVEATGKLPKKLNFPLYQIDEPDTFQVIVMGDPQVRSNEEINYLRDDIVAEIVGSEAKFVVALGDIMFDNLSLFDRYEQVMAQISVPIYNVAGNHDRNYDAKDDVHSLETFISHFGPQYYSFNYGKVHFVLLDDVEHYIEEGKAKYRGNLNDKQLLWLKNDLQFVDPEYLIVLMMHSPLYWLEDEAEQGLNIQNGDRLLDVLKDRNSLLSLAGHTHMIQHSYIDSRQGFMGANPIHNIVCATACGAWWKGPKDERGIPVSPMQDGAPNGYHIFEFKGNQYTEKFKPAFGKNNFQMRISSPKGTIVADEVQNTQILVNVFDGGEKSMVMYKIDDLPERKMKQTPMKDPFLDELLERTLEEKSKIKPRQTHHIWTAPIEDELSVGVHKLLVVTKDQFGQIFKATKIFEIE